MAECVICQERPAEPGYLACPGCSRRLSGDLIAIPEVWLQLWSLGSVERDVREGFRAVLDGDRVVRVPAMADPVANVLSAGPASAGWRTSQIRSTRPERVPVNLDVVDVTGPVNHAARSLHVRAVLGLEPDQEGHLSAATVLHRWVLRWAARRREGEPLRLVGRLAGWLRDRLDWACEHDELLAEFAEEIHELRTVMDGLAGNFRPLPERVDRPCPACGWWALSHDRAAELIRCGNCDRALTDDEYRDHLEDVIKTNWTVVDEDDTRTFPPDRTLVWLRAADGVTVGFTADFVANGLFLTMWGKPLDGVSYWAPMVLPADPGPAKEPA